MGSTALNGSSAIRTSGRGASARARAMRWRSPPENAAGRRSGDGRVEADGIEELGDTSAVVAVDAQALEGSRMLAPTGSRVERAAGVLGDDADRPPQGSRRAGRHRLAAEPDLAASGASRASSRRSSVDLPEPEAPTIARSRPAGTSRSIPSSAVRATRRHGRSPGTE